MSDTSPSDGALTRPDGQTVEYYDTEDGVVLYDADNPMGWVQSDTPIGLESMR
jgi:hypothetical protein